MADVTKVQSLHLEEHQVLEVDDLISSEQTLDYNSIPNCSNLFEDDDLVNIDDEYVPYTFTFDPFSPFNSSFFVPSSSSPLNHQVKSNSSSESESPDSTVYPDCLYGHDDEYDQMDFITDLFDSRGEIEHRAINDHDEDFVSNNTEELEFGLRVAGIESDSDTEELGQVDDRIESSDFNLEHFWECPSFDTARVEERDGLSSVIDRIEEISISSEISSQGDVAVGVLEWEILLAVNNLERDLELVTDGGDGFVYTPEFDTLIGQFVETVRALRGSPPAAKSIVDNLPLVALKKGDHVICAVCKDEILTEEKVNQLPCRHHYHGECIKPWLCIRNTCPVCRFELPTDDVDYERSKNRVNDELRVGYDFQLSP